MVKHFIKIEYDLFCMWDNVNAPSYRVYVNNELFTERTYRQNGECYISDTIQLDAPPGKYTITIENLNKEATFNVRNMQVTYGNEWAKMVSTNTIEIV